MPTFLSWVHALSNCNELNKPGKAISTVVFTICPRWESWDYFKPHGAETMGLNKTLTAPSPQANCLSSLSWQQVAAAVAIFLVKAISSGGVSWGAFFVYATRNLEETFFTKSWIICEFWDSSLLKDPLLVSEAMRSAHLLYPHGTGTTFRDAFTLTTTPCTSILSTYHNGKTNAGW